MITDEKVLRFAPSDFYDENLDMLAVYRAQGIEVNVADKNSYQNFLNNFVLHCNLEGIRRWEKLFNILADEVNDSLEYRQHRVLQRLVMQPPYTKIFLNQMLTNLFGADKYSLQIDENLYKISIYIETSSDDLYNDTLNNIRIIVPANMTITAIMAEKYMHIYLEKNYTYEEMEQFTYGELSKYAEDN